MRKRAAAFIRSHSIACIALFFALSAPASALIITGALVADESLTGADIKNESLNAADVDELSLDNPVWAVVEANGSLASAGQAGTSVRKLNTGLYSVTFPRDVTNCAPTANMFSQGGPGVFTPLGTITVIVNPPQTNDVLAVTVADNGINADRRFALSVAC